MVEIGGSFRIPDIMSACGASLREVGTTNKTRAADYAAAINENTKALMKVHTSNYRIVGFSESVSIKELADLGREKIFRFLKTSAVEVLSIWSSSESMESPRYRKQFELAQMSSLFREINCWEGRRPVSLSGKGNILRS